MPVGTALQTPQPESQAWPIEAIRHLPVGALTLMPWGGAQTLEGAPTNAQARTPALGPSPDSPWRRLVAAR